MKNKDVVRRFARQFGVSRAEAADRVDHVVHQILAGLRRGKRTSLPGLGTFSQGGDGRALFERDGGSNEAPQD